MNTTGGDFRHHLYWETALDRLELDVILAERLLADPAADPSDAAETWDEPRLEEPIPADLVARARELRGRQDRVQAALTVRLGTLHREHAFAARVDRATSRCDRPVYLDITA